MESSGTVCGRRHAGIGIPRAEAVVAAAALQGVRAKLIIIIVPVVAVVVVVVIVVSTARGIVVVTALQVATCTADAQMSKQCERIDE